MGPWHGSSPISRLPRRFPKPNNEHRRRSSSHLCWPISKNKSSSSTGWTTPTGLHWLGPGWSLWEWSAINTWVAPFPDVSPWPMYTFIAVEANNDVFAVASIGRFREPLPPASSGVTTGWPRGRLFQLNGVDEQGLASRWPQATPLASRRCSSSPNNVSMEPWWTRSTWPPTAGGAWLPQWAIFCTWVRMSYHPWETGKIGHSRMPNQPWPSTTPTPNTANRWRRRRRCGEPWRSSKTARPGKASPSIRSKWPRKQEGSKSRSLWGRTRTPSGPAHLRVKIRRSDLQWAKSSRRKRLNAEHVAVVRTPSDTCRTSSTGSSYPPSSGTDLSYVEPTRPTNASTPQRHVRAFTAVQSYAVQEECAVGTTGLENAVTSVFSQPTCLNNLDRLRHPKVERRRYLRLTVRWRRLATRGPQNHPSLRGGRKLGRWNLPTCQWWSMRTPKPNNTSTGWLQHVAGLQRLLHWSSRARKEGRFGWAACPQRPQLTSFLGQTFRWFASKKTWPAKGEWYSPRPWLRRSHLPGPKAGLTSGGWRGHWFEIQSGQEIRCWCIAYPADTGQQPWRPCCVASWPENHWRRVANGLPSTAMWSSRRPAVRMG